MSERSDLIVSKYAHTSSRSRSQYVSVIGWQGLIDRIAASEPPTNAITVLMELVAELRLEVRLLPLDNQI